MTIADQLREHALYHETAQFILLGDAAFQAVSESGFYRYHRCSISISETLRRFYLLMLAESLS